MNFKDIKDVMDGKSCYRIAKTINEHYTEWGFDRGISANYLQLLRRGERKSPTLETYDKVVRAMNKLTA
jgi:hypothetical protein